LTGEGGNFKPCTTRQAIFYSRRSAGP